MAIYDLTTLSDWVRRVVGDTVITFREDYTGDGARRLEMRNDGAIRLRQIEVDDVELPQTEYSLEGNRIRWINDSSRPAEDSNIYVVYDRSERSDSDYADRLADAARSLTGTIFTKWMVSADDATIDDVANEILPDGINADNAIEKLIVHRTALNILNESATTSARDAISIRDGDTAIDTSKGAGNVAAIVKQVQDTYNKELNFFLANRFVGKAQSA